MLAVISPPLRAGDQAREMRRSESCGRCRTSQGPEAAPGVPAARGSAATSQCARSEMAL